MEDEIGKKGKKIEESGKNRKDGSRIDEKGRKMSREE